jgi:hypothetical protein
MVQLKANPMAMLVVDMVQAKAVENVSKAIM